jgi:hypothetical protein
VYEQETVCAYGTIWRLSVSLLISDYIVKKALVSLAIENALLELSDGEFDKVTNFLNKKYDCYIPDCFEHPEYLKDALDNLYGETNHKIIESIIHSLEKFSYQKLITEFLMVISN